MDHLKENIFLRFRQDSEFVVLECRVPHPHEGIHLWKKKDKKNKNNVQWLYKQEHVVVQAYNQMSSAISLSCSFFLASSWRWRGVNVILLDEGHSLRLAARFAADCLLKASGKP